MVFTVVNGGKRKNQEKSLSPEHVKKRTYPVVYRDSYDIYLMFYPKDGQGQKEVNNKMHAPLLLVFLLRGYQHNFQTIPPSNF